MVGFAFIVEGMSVTPRPVLWSGIDLEVEGLSWSGAVCHSIIRLSLLPLQAISTLCVTGKTSSSLMWYPSCRLILTCMTLQHDNATSHTARSVRDFLQDRNVSVLPWPAKSPDLKVRARAIPSRNVRELAGALVEEWGNISQQELSKSMRRRCTAVLMQLVATPDTDCYFFPPFPRCSGHIVPFLLVTCLWNLFIFCLLLNLVFIEIFTR